MADLAMNPRAPRAPSVSAASEPPAPRLRARANLARAIDVNIANVRTGEASGCEMRSGRGRTEELCSGLSRLACLPCDSAPRAWTWSQASWGRRPPKWISDDRGYARGPAPGEPTRRSARASAVDRFRGRAARAALARSPARSIDRARGLQVGSSAKGAKPVAPRVECRGARAARLPSPPACVLLCGAGGRRCGRSGPRPSRRDAVQARPSVALFVVLQVRPQIYILSVMPLT
jgi:hypothetical protein